MTECLNTNPFGKQAEHFLIHWFSLLKTQVSFWCYIVWSKVMNGDRLVKSNRYITFLGILNQSWGEGWEMTRKGPIRFICGGFFHNIPFGLQENQIHLWRFFFTICLLDSKKICYGICKRDGYLSA